MKKLSWSLLLSLAFLVNCETSTKSPPKESKATESWSENMQKLATNLTEFFPLIYSQRNFNNPTNEKRINQYLRELLEASHTIVKGATPNFAASDPGMRFMADRLDAELKMAQENFKNGNKEYARRAAQSVVKNCVFCHSQNQLGPQFDSKFVTQNYPGLLKTERADLLIATRNYDAAIKELESALADKEYVTQNPFETERALRRYLAVTVRVKKDPTLAYELMQKTLAQGVRPEYLSDLVKSWRDSLAQWRNEMAAKKKPAKLSPVDQAKQLIQKAQVVQDYPVDNAGDVYYLRATAILHDYLLQSPDGKDAVRALLLLGTSYEVLNEIGLWDISDRYYEECIRKSPHTEISLVCYKKIEQSTYAGYSGSGGVFIPSSVRQRLAELKELSKPTTR